MGKTWGRSWSNSKGGNASSKYVPEDILIQVLPNYDNFDSALFDLLNKLDNLGLFDDLENLRSVVSDLLENYNNRVVRKLQFQNNFRLKNGKFQGFARKFARLVRQLTELSNKSIIKSSILTISALFLVLSCTILVK